MGTLLIILNQLTGQAESMFVKHHGSKYTTGWRTFNAIITCFSAIFFIISDKNGFYFPPALFLYGEVSCICYAIGFYGLYMALQYGSFTLTKIIISFSCVFPVIYGIGFLGEGAGVVTYIALALMAASIILMNLKKEEGNTQKKISVKWLVLSLAAAVSNGFISIISRMQQMHFSSMCDNEFLILSLGGAFIIFAVSAILREKPSVKDISKNGSIFGILAGLSNGATNVTNLAIYLYIPISLAIPIKTGLGIIISFAVSVLIYREKFTKLQVLSVLLGILSLVLFKIG